MTVVFIILGFLVPVVMVFAFSIWLNRRHRNRSLNRNTNPDAKETNSDSE